MENTSKNSSSTNDNNSSPPKTTQNSPSNPPSEQNTPRETNPRETQPETTIMKTPQEVLAELSAGDDEIIENSGRSGGNRDTGAARSRPTPRVVTTTLTIDGRSRSSTVEGGSGAPALKKRKNTQVKDPPSGTPTCPECGRKFSTWKAAFGHMRTHPERPHRGFFPPPTFTANKIAPRAQPRPQSTPTNIAPRAQPQGDGGNKISEGMASVVRELVIDLNRSIGTKAESSAGGSGNETGRNQGGRGSGRNQAVAVAPPAENEGGRRKNFDLNELPSQEEDDNEEKKHDK